MRKKTKNEVFTPYWTAINMIKKDKDYQNDIFLEPSTGDGNFLMAILRAKLANLRHCQNKQQWLNKCLEAITSIYGIELFADNVKKAHLRMINYIKSDYQRKYSKCLTSYFCKLIKQIINNNVIQGNTLTNQNNKKQDLKLYKWRINGLSAIKTENTMKLDNKDKYSTFKPDYVIGNPPYNIRNHTKNNNSYSQIFNLFVDKALSITPHYVAMIIPNRWFSGGKNLNKFRKMMLNNIHLEGMKIWNNSKDLFPNVAINGGVNYFIWNKNFDNTQKGIKISLMKKRKVINQAIRPLSLPNIDVFIKDNIGMNILQKILPDLKKDNLANHISASCPFGLRPYYPKRSSHWHTSKISDAFKCYGGNHKVGYVKRNIVLDKINAKRAKQKYIKIIPKYKLITSRANGIGISKTNLIKLYLCEPNSICTESFIVLGWDLGLNKKELLNLSKYIQSKFVRFLISLHKSSQDAVRKVYKLVPLQNFSNNSNIDWNKNIDKQLEKKYNLSSKEIKHIQNII